MLFYKIFLISLLLVNKSLCLPLPYNQYAYMKARDQLTFREINLSPKEKCVNLHMETLKQKEFLDTLKYFYPARPIETELVNITSRDMYKFLKNLPKGGNLHIHEFQMLDRRKLLEIVFKQTEFEWVYICDKAAIECKTNLSLCNCSNHNLAYFAKSAPLGWTKVKDSNWTIDSILTKTTLTGILNNLEEKIYPTDSNGRWRVANQNDLFNIYSQLTNFNKTRFEYLKACLDTSLEENVQLVEFRRSNFGSLFYFDSNGDEVKIDSASELEALKKFKIDYIRNNPNWIDFIFLIYGSRRASKSAVRADLEECLEIQPRFPDLIRGYDLVGEEDAGHTLLFHSDSLMGAFNYSRSSNKTFDLVFHTIETSWPADLPPAQYGDSVATLDNIYDSILLQTKRIGHGIGLIKNPGLYKYLKEREIAVEVCPASNQILGYVSDLRNHPAVNYFRSGVPIVLAGDDPGSFGYNDLTVEYYLAYMAWGLDLYDLKVIANNSIKYSMIPDDIKLLGFEKFENLWNNFINETYQSILLNKTKSNDMKAVNVSDLLPSYGPNDKSIEVSIYGYGFEIAVCEEVICIFGDIRTSGEQIKLNEIKCKTPIVNLEESNITKSVEVYLEINSNVYSTYFNYTFLPSNELTLVDDDVGNSNSKIKYSLSCLLLSLALNYINLFR